MIEKMSEAEIMSLIDEIQKAGYAVGCKPKRTLFKEAVKEVIGERAYVTEDIRNAIYKIADVTTEVERGATRNLRSTEEMAKYKECIKRILQAIKPYYGACGFCEDTIKK